MLHEELVTFWIATPPARLVSMSVLSKSNNITFTDLPSIAGVHCSFSVNTETRRGLTAEVLLPGVLHDGSCRCMLFFSFSTHVSLIL